MPLTTKGEEIKVNMEKEYGAEKGEQVFYASKNAGTISGVDVIAGSTTVHGGPGLDAVLNWAGGDQVITPGGEGDTKTPPVPANKAMGNG